MARLWNSFRAPRRETAVQMGTKALKGPPYPLSRAPRARMTLMQPLRRLWNPEGGRSPSEVERRQWVASRRWAATGEFYRLSGGKRPSPVIRHTRKLTFERPLSD